MSDSRKYFQPDVLNKITPLELRARYVVDGFLSGLHRSRYKGLSVEFASHRQYAPGDDLRHIDWRVFGRADRYFIKEHEVETNMSVQILLDCSGSMAYPEHADSGRMRKWDYAATVAASLAHLLIRQQDAVGLVLFDEAVRARLPASARRAALHGLIEFIERADPEGMTRTGVLFRRLADGAGRRGLVVLVSDLLMDVDDLIAGLQRFRFNRQDVLVLHVLDSDELTFPFMDRTQFEGMEEAGVEVLTDPQSLRGSYLAALQAYLTRVRAVCLNHRIDYELFSTAEALDVVLARFLAYRKSRLRAGA